MDLFLDGRIRLIQPRKGYRFSADALLLAKFATIKTGERIIDLGTGCGIIMLIVLSLNEDLSMVTGIELQKDLTYQAQRNIILNNFTNKGFVVQGDIRDIPFIQGTFDVAICNPPYHPAPDGRINPDLQKAIARHEITLSLKDILIASKRILRPHGRLAMIYPPDRMTQIIETMRTHRFEPKRIQLVYPSTEVEARLLLIEAVLEGKTGLRILPPLIDSGHPG
jgi:tRNA1(Val) A37 N6-methylase TrmN6